MTKPTTRKKKNSLGETLVCNGVRVQVTSHAVEQYFNRIKGRDFVYSSGHERSQVRKQIAKTVSEPEDIYHGKPKMPPIHILGEAAVVVRTLGTTKADVLVPTVYHKNTFVDEG